jgi:putative endonuclease
MAPGRRRTDFRSVTLNLSPTRDGRRHRGDDGELQPELDMNAIDDRRGSRRILGLAGEAAAESRLRTLGLTIVARGFRARCGEIDLVARDGRIVVFIEVKTRSGTGFGSPAEAVTAEKRRRLARVASLFLVKSGWGHLPCRFDVVEVVPVGADFRVRHIEDAFRPGD